MFQSFVFVV